MAQRPDDIDIPSPNDTQFPIHSDGQHAMVCVDVINLGRKVEQYQNNPPRLTPKCVIVWASGERDEQGNLLTVSKEFTVSMNTNSAGVPSALRKVLGDWRGREYSEEEAKHPPPLAKLSGVPALVTVQHKANKAGTRLYANILTVAKCPPVMVKEIGKVDDYRRGDWWAKRKAEYAEEVAKYEAAQPRKATPKPQPPVDEYEEVPQGEELPF